MSELRGTPVIRDPYPHYAALRASAPVAFAEEHGVWVVSRHAACVELLKRPSHFRPIERLWPPPEQTNGVRTGGGARRRAVGRCAAQPTGGRLKLSQQAVYRALVAMQRDGDTPDVDRLVAQTLQRCANATRVEVVGEFARPLVQAVMGRFFGFPRAIWSAYCDAHYERLRPTQTAEARIRRDLLNPLGSLPSLRAALQAAIAAGLRERRTPDRSDLPAGVAAQLVEGEGEGRGRTRARRRAFWRRSRPTR